MRTIIGILFVTVLMILAVLMYGEYMWGKGYREGFEQAEKYCKESSNDSKTVDTEIEICSRRL